MNITIRKATRNDAPIIAQFNYNLCFETEHGHQLNMDILLQGCQAAFDKKDLCQYYVAEVENQIIGQLMYTFEWSDWHNGLRYWIQSVYVKKQFRGQGVFRRLYEHVKNITEQDSGVTGIRLYVETENIAAQQVYQKLGMHNNGYLVYAYDKPLKLSMIESHRKSTMSIYFLNI